MSAAVGGTNGEASAAMSDTDFNDDREPAVNGDADGGAASGGNASGSDVQQPPRASRLQRAAGPEVSPPGDSPQGAGDSESRSQ